jgi:hypothetical protein
MRPPKNPQQIKMASKMQFLLKNRLERHQLNSIFKCSSLKIDPKNIVSFLNSIAETKMTAKYKKIYERRHLELFFYKLNGYLWML